MLNRPIARNLQQSVGFWSNIDSGVTIDRFRGRVMAGGASLYSADRSVGTGSWLTSASAGANWLPRDSGICYIHERGGTAVSGLTKASLGSGLSGGISAIGVAGYAIQDLDSSAAWALYGDIQHESGTSRSSYGLELAIKNKGSNFISTPAALTYGPKGVWLAAGGDNSYGGSAANPSDAGIVFKKNASTWNTGIVFANDSITGTDGTTGTGNALHLSTRHLIRWMLPDGNAGGYIYSSASTAGHQTAITLADDSVQVFGGNTPVSICRLVSIGDTAANYPRFKNAATGDPVEVDAQGDDTNIDIKFTPKGSGVISFGTRTATTTELLSGYILIKDAGGTSRKLAVVS